jgi:hypothetical protein
LPVIAMVGANVESAETAGTSFPFRLGGGLTGSRPNSLT